MYVSYKAGDVVGWASHNQWLIEQIKKLMK
jgi:hypothetical protein